MFASHPSAESRSILVEGRGHDVTQADYNCCETSEEESDKNSYYPEPREGGNGMR